MTPDADAWARVGTLFDELADLTPEHRSQRLARESLPADLERWLQRLLAAHDQPSCEVLDRTLDGLVQELTGHDALPLQFIPEQLSGHRFGNWRAREEIARGGMAVVLRGERADGHFEKDVAIKLLLPGPHTHQHHQRFIEEIRILARLEHPHIARLIDGGLSAEGWPYLVMEYVDGMPITQYCDHHRLSITQRLRLWRDVAHAVSHAHQHLVVHCDIKPSNALVNCGHQVKLVDFGIAGLLDMARGEQTPPALRCSPAYAAPEQIRGAPAATAHDVFSLGALLYQLLCGSRIRTARQLTHAVLQTPLKSNIPAPSATLPDNPRDPRYSNRHTHAARLKRQLRGDGDAICLRALAPDATQRYPTVNALIADVHRWQHQRAVHARNGSGFYYAGKWLARNRWLAGGATMAILSLAIGTAVALWQAREARAEAALSGATRDFLLDMFNAVDPWRNQQTPVTANQLVDRAVERLPQRLTRHPAQKAEILHTLGEILRRMGRAGDAQSLHEQATALWSDLDRSTALHRAMVGLANDHLDLLNLEAAAPLLDTVIAQAPWPPQDGSAVEARLLKVQLLTRHGQLQAQQALLDELLAAQPAITHLADSSTLLSELYLIAAETMENRAQYDAALDYARQAIEQTRHTHGPNHPLEARAHSYIATTEHARGNYPAAQQAMRQFLNIVRDYHGEDHPETRWGLYTLARILNDSGDYQAAIAINETLVEQLIRLYGDDNPRLGVTYANLGKAWHGLGNLERALDYYARGLPTIAANEAEHPKLGTYYALYAQALSEHGATAQARDYFHRGLAILQDKLGMAHPVYATAQVAWGEHLLREGETRAATTALQQAYQTLHKTHGPHSAQTALAHHALGNALAASGDTQSARDHWQQALTTLTQPRHRNAQRQRITQLEQQLER